MKTARDTKACKRLLSGESLPRCLDHRHLTVCPLDTKLAARGHRKVFYIMATIFLNIVPPCSSLSLSKKSINNYYGKCLASSELVT